MSTSTPANMNQDAIDYAEAAIIRSWSEVAVAKLALQNSHSPVVRSYAEQMIEDHTRIVQELVTLAERKDLQIASASALKQKAEKFRWDLRQREAFDLTYADHQIAEHKEALRLFRTASKSEDVDIRYLSNATLSKLAHHLQMAQDLADHISNNRHKAYKSLASAHDFSAHDTSTRPPADLFGESLSANKRLFVEEEKIPLEDSFTNSQNQFVTERS